MLSFFDSENNDDLLKKYLMVDISDVIYAFKIESVKEIIPVIDMFSIETVSNNLTGLINLRGKTIPVYDIRGFLGKELKPFSVNQKFLLLEGDKTDFAIIIDNVGDIISISDKDISNINYNRNFDFLKTTIIEDKTIIITDAQGFYNYAQIAENIKKADTAELQIKEQTSVEKIKNRTALLNQNGQFILQDETLLNEKFIIFNLEEEIYAFNISYVKEIKKIHMNTISHVPCVPDFILGIINFRGDYISLLDIKSFLNIEKTNYPEKIEIVILKVNDLKLAIVVDKVLDITALHIEHMNAEKNTEDTFIIGDIPYINNRMINLLNVEKLFSSENVNIEVYD